MPIQRLQRPGGAGASAFAGVLLVTLLGLLGMHGLSSHGVHGAGAGHAATPIAHHGHEPADPGVTVAGTPDGSATALLGAGCLAIIAGLGFALLADRRLRRALEPSDRGRRPYAAFVARPPGRGPPTLAELSILRC